MHYDCLIVDDETAIASSTSEYFNLFELSSAYVTSYEQCIRFFKENTVSLLLLDINLGGRSGFSLCKKLREQTDIPILFISARTSDDDILTALNIGGDDYITKPFEPTELVARVEAVLRRCGKAQGTLAAFDVVLDPAARRVTRSGTPLHLTPREFDLLEVLLRNRGIVLYREVLYERVWGLDAEYDSRTLDLHIQRLRKKLGWKNEIRTVFRVGYVLERGE